MIKVAFVRGKYLNNFEGQNYLFDDNIKITGISSLFPLHKVFPFPVTKFLSPADVNLPFIKFLANRTIGDMHLLFCLEHIAGQFDIYHTADPYYYFSYQLARLRSKNKIRRLISTSWETIPFNNESARAKKHIKYFTQRWVDLFIVYTKRAKDSLVLEGVPEKKIRIVRLGVDLNTFKPIKKKSHSPFVVLFVGRDVPEKGLDDLKKAVTKLSNVNIKPMYISSNIPYEQMPSVYREADVLVMPSKRSTTWEEQYGMVLVEGLASGLPIVAYDTGSVRELVGDAGILIKPDVEKLSKSIELLVQNTNLCSFLSVKARVRAEKYFNSQNTAREIGTIYHDII